MARETNFARRLEELGCYSTRTATTSSRSVTGAFVPMRGSSLAFALTSGPAYASKQQTWRLSIFLHAISDCAEPSQLPSRAFPEYKMVPEAVDQLIEELLHTPVSH